MISIKNFGWRLGNQMFQIAAMEGWSKKTGYKIEYPNWEYSKVFKGDFTNTHKLTPIKYYTEKNFSFDEIPNENNLMIEGYFQSEKYFNNCEEHIREIFDLRDDIKEKIESKFINLNFSELVSIHVRRTDYLKLPSHHPVCDMEYYSNAIKLFEGFKFLIFSDDMEWCKENFKGDNFIFSEGNGDYEDMYIMSKCHSNIICNSTFSWWGAWLNKNKNKKVVSPKKWFGTAYSHFSTKDLYLNNWILI
jgi:hypothetical protein